MTSYNNESGSMAAPETKAGGGNAAVTAAFDDMMEAFETYRASNEERLEALEAGRPDVLLDEKLARIDTALDHQKAKLDKLFLDKARPAMYGGTKSAGTDEHKAAFEAYVRKGDDSAIKQLERKAMSVGSDADGGYLVPSETEAGIGRLLTATSPIRSIASVQKVSSSVYRKPFATTGAATGWAAETASRSQTNAPNIAELTFPTMELYAMPAATPALLDDAVVDIDAWLASEVETAFAEQEGTAFVTGDGTNKPKGFLDSTMVAESSWAWNKLGYVATGVDGAFPAEDASDILIDLIYTLKSGYRQNATFVMNRRTQAAIRKMKDTDGNYVWAPPASAGAHSTLMNFPIVEAEDMPDIDSDSYSIAFGDFKRGYLIVDRAGVRILRDPYSAKPYVLFYTTKRVGGGVQDFDAIKLLKFAAS